MRSPFLAKPVADSIYEIGCEGYYGFKSWRIKLVVERVIYNDRYLKSHGFEKCNCIFDKIRQCVNFLSDIKLLYSHSTKIKIDTGDKSIIGETIQLRDAFILFWRVCYQDVHQYYYQLYL